MGRNPIQELRQKLCQRYGWSDPEILADANDASVFHCTVQVGVRDVRIFSGESPAAAAQAALDGLRNLAEEQEGKLLQELHQVFPSVPVYESNQENWQWFWNHKPPAVGIDTEGNQISPPVLVQISTPEYCILEVPRRGRLSLHLQRLLNDASIIKVFCDNFSHRDKLSLGIHLNNDGESSSILNMTSGPIVELEHLAALHLGKASTARGLARILTAAMGDDLAQVRLGKPPRSKNQRWKDIGRFALIEQGKAKSLRRVADLTAREQQYAALDAWCTLEAFSRLTRGGITTILSSTA
eukprot:scaffold1953_cov176-Amphora_coffeaeformis.AAC.31